MSGRRSLLARVPFYDLWKVERGRRARAEKRVSELFHDLTVSEADRRVLREQRDSARELAAALVMVDGWSESDRAHMAEWGVDG